MSTATDDAELRAYSRPTIRRNATTVSAIVAAGAIIAIATPAVTSALYGDRGYDSIAISFPGTATSVAATVATTIATASGWALIGLLVSLLFLLAPTGRTRDVVYGLPELRWAQIAAGTWALSAAALIPLDAADKNGQPFTRIFEPTALPYLIDASYFPKAWIATFLFATVALLTLLFAETWRGLLAPLWCTVLGVLAPVIVGQILVGPNHDFGSDAGAIQTVAVAAAAGIVWALSARVATGRLLRPDTTRRTWLTLSVLWTLAAVMEFVLIPFKLNGPSEGNPTVFLLAARAAVLALFGAVLLFLWLRRTRLTDRTIVRALATGSLLGAAALALTGALERIPPPQYFSPSSIMTVFFGFELTQAPTIGVLLSTWRPNILFILISAVMITVYAVAVRRLRRRGDHWPMGRAVSWYAGWITVVFATSSGFGAYSGSDFGIHMIVHMGLNMLAPVLMVMGGVVTLLLRATTPRGIDQPAGPHEWITAVLHWRVTRFLYNPLVVFALFIGSYYALYLTGLFENLIRFHWAHQAMNIHFIIVGYLFYGLIIGVDRPPRPLPPIGKLGFVLAAMPFHAFFGVILMMATVPIAENFYRTLDLPWQPDLMAAQYVGGGVAWAGGELPLIIVIIALGVQWARQDQREAKRKDRHLDAGLDDEFTDYNRMLAALSQRDAAATQRDTPATQHSPAPTGEKP